MTQIYLILFCAFFVAEQQVSSSTNDSDITTVMQENTFWETESWGACDSGSLQSPINIFTDDVLKDGALGEEFVISQDFSLPLPMATYHRSFNTYVLQNEQVDGPTVSGGGIEGGDFTFLMLALFFGNPSSNTGSQHILDGKQFAGEVNMYFGDGHTVNTSNKMMAFSVFIEISDDSDDMESMSLKKLFQNAKSLGAMGDAMDMNGEIYLSQLTPFDDEKKMKDFFRYSGSLVVPPCEEKVQWTVFEHPIYLKSDTYAMIFDTDEDTVNEDVLMDNFRPLQPLSGREVRKPRNGRSTVFISPFAVFALLLIALAN